jgi:hypothetical protein
VSLPRSEIVKFDQNCAPSIFGLLSIKPLDALDPIHVIRRTHPRRELRSLSNAPSALFDDALQRTTDY